MGVTPGKKSPKKTPKQKSPAESEPMETAVISPEKKTAKSPSNGLEKKSDSTKKKSLKRKLDDGEYEENTEEIKNSETVIIEEDLNDSQKESGKKQKKKKKHGVDNQEENKSADGAKKKTGVSNDDDDEEGKNIPSECKLFVTSIGLEDMTKNDLKDYFKSLGYGLVLTIKQSKSRHAFIGFATVKEATKAIESLDKTDCRGFPLSVDSKDLMLSALHLFKKRKASQLINTEGTADCSLYVSPITPTQTKQNLMDSFIGVVSVIRKGPNRNWVRLVCANSTVAKELHKSHQGKVVEGSALRLETAEEFRKRITEEDAAKVIEFRKQKQREQKMEKKKKEPKTKEKKSSAEPKESNDGSDEGDDEDDVRVVNDDSDSDEEEVVPKAKKAKGAAPKSKKVKEVQPKLKKAKVAGKR